MCNVLMEVIDELLQKKNNRNSFIVVNKPNHTDKALRRIEKDLKRQQKKKS